MIKKTFLDEVVKRKMASNLLSLSWKNFFDENFFESDIMNSAQK